MCDAVTFLFPLTTIVDTLNAYRTTKAFCSFRICTSYTTYNINNLLYSPLPCSMGNAKRAVLGRSVPSPQKKRKKSDREVLTFDLQVLRKKNMKAQLDILRNRSKPVAKPEDDASLGPSNGQSGNLPADTMDPLVESDGGDVPQDPDDDENMMAGSSSIAFDNPLPLPTAASPVKQPRKDSAERWQGLLPTLVEPLLTFRDRTVGKVLESFDGPSPCATGSCIILEADIQVIKFDSHQVKKFHHCRCQSLPQVLVAHGLFPTAPLQPRMAISIALLDFYQTLCQFSSDAVTALAGGLAMVYRRRGFRLCSPTGEALQDPIRRGLGHSLQWYDALVVAIERHVTEKVDALKETLPKLPDTISSLPSTLSRSKAFDIVSSAKATPNPSVTLTASDTTSAASTTTGAAATSSTTPSANPSATSGVNPSSTSIPSPSQPASPTQSPPTTTTDNSTSSGSPLPLQSGACHPYLQRLCPACFGGSEFGRSFQQGGDIHVALDGNFHHRHLKSGGDGKPFHSSVRFLSKEFVKSVGERLTEARGRPPKPREVVVPDDVVDSDRDAYKAAKGDSQKKPNDIFDENGLMALVCRHDIPIFVTSIDMPGEQQKDAVALLEALFLMLPLWATVAALYDIACVLDRSTRMYDFFPDGIASRLQFATALLHAYGHQWHCQLHYNPRLRPGLGITDGEGTERLWSRLRKLIGLERRASRAVRIWMLDRQCDAIARDIWEDLGKWVRRKIHKNVQKKEGDAVRTLHELSYTVEELRKHWEAQLSEQSSSRSLAPARLKKVLAKVLQLQAQIDALDEEIAEAKAAIRMMDYPPSDATFILQNLEATHRKLKSEAEALYSSLNINDEYPELKNLPLDYLHKLILARDLKITIRKKAIGSFFEWDKLDMAVGGMHEALGTKAHQVTRDAIARRKGVFETLIRKFNQYVTELEEGHRLGYCIPVPKRLPTQLTTLWDMETSHLWEDVWICEDVVPPNWLVDDDVRKGIRAVLALDHCAEERIRLQMEAKNLCHWFRDELQALKLMSQDQRYVKYRSVIRLWLADHLLLIDTWSNPFVPVAVFRDQIQLVERWVASPSTCETATYQARVGTALPSPPSQAQAHNTDMAQADAPSSTPYQPVDPNTSTTHRAAAPNNQEPNKDDLEDEEDEVEIVGERIALQDVIDDDVDSDDAEESLCLVWEMPDPLRMDATLWTGVKCYPFVGKCVAWSALRSVWSTSRLQYTFGGAQLARIDHLQRWLDDELVNGCVILLQQAFQTQDDKCAILSSHVIPQLLRNNDSSLDAAWRYNCGSQYWRRPVWILPIHDKTTQHWALAVIRVEAEEIHVFDSFGHRSFISDWLLDIQRVVCRLATLAKDQGLPVSPSLAVLSSWIAKPLQVGQLQHNTHDCGVWVLWLIATLVRGFDFAPITEEGIGQFRKFLARLIRTVPV
ncbi:hypothetical protein PM082_007535 [Marasmius tenuissimus]|nr:hypothetical protein PM082_007535 [Marasmius tenuissimus]